MQRRDGAVMLGLVALGCVVTIAFAERIGVNSGLGWDGQAYGHWAQDFAGVVEHHGLDQFQAQRVLPSVIVHYSLAAVGAPASVENVIAGFQLLDAFMLLAAAACLCRIARVLGWSRAAAWAAFASMFGGFAIARHALYDPVLTDPTAFGLGALAVLGYVERRTWLVLASALLAMFVWPASIVINAAALAFPRATSASDDAPPWAARIRRGHLGALAAAIAGAVMVAWVVKVLGGYHYVDGMDGILARGHRDLWPVTIAVLVLTAALAGWFLGAAWTGPRLIGSLRRTRLRTLALAAIAVAALLAIKMAWTARVASSTGFSLEALEYYYVGNALRAPLWNLVHHVVYVGPLVLLLILRWPRVATAATRWGVAPSIVWAAVVFVGVTPETRHLIAFLPWMVVLAIDATSDLWTDRALVVYALLTVAWSKVWFIIGYDAHHDSFRFPDQRYMMNLGPWATDGPFLVHATAAVASAILLGWSLRRSPRSSLPIGVSSRAHELSAPGPRRC